LRVFSNDGLKQAIDRALAGAPATRASQ